MLHLRVSVSFTYVKADGRHSQREVDVQWCDGVHFSGYCNLRHADRSFRIDRVESASVTGRHSRPAAAAPKDREFWGSTDPGGGGRSLGTGTAALPAAISAPRSYNSSASQGTGCCVLLLLPAMIGLICAGVHQLLQ